MKRIAVTGYYGTGSSAVIDLLTEYNNVKVSVGERYEHFIFMCKGGLFDLETRLFSENSNYMIRDIAINDFIREMKMQNDNDFGWYGSYKKLYGDKFNIIFNKFIDAISYEVGKNEFAHSTGLKYSPFKAILQIGASILTGYKIHKLGRVYVHDKNTTRYLMVDHQQFLVYAREFVNDYFNLCSDNTSITILDHLIFPEQVAVVDKFFDDDFRLIIVDRDPRDIFLSGKYIWSTTSFGKQTLPYSLDVNRFCDGWKFVHSNIEKIESNKILKVKFEDLVYNYQNTVKMILEFCGINSNDKKDGIKNFVPQESINNTQVFNMSEEYLNESNVIASELSAYCYNFPFKKDGNISQVFDK